MRVRRRRHPLRLREPRNDRPHDIRDRIDEVPFTSALAHGLRAVLMANDLVDAGDLAAACHRRIRLPIVEARKRMRPRDGSSKLNAEWALLPHLVWIGREAARPWRGRHFDDPGQRSGVGLRQMPTGVGMPPDACRQ